MGAAESRQGGAEEGAVEGIVTVAAPDQGSLDAPDPLLQQLQELPHVSVCSGLPPAWQYHSSPAPAHIRPRPPLLKEALL